jgi:ubiquitin carboxyl-terminal hydrolase 22/27/51
VKLQYLPISLSHQSSQQQSDEKETKKRKLDTNNNSKVIRRDSDAYRKSIATKTPELIGLRGLNNLGNTCFMNCVLQSLCHNPLMRNYFLGMTKPLKLIEKQQQQQFPAHLSDEQKFRSVDVELQRLMHEIYNGESRPYNPHCFLYTMWNVAGHLAGYQQQDAHEFLMAILGALSSSPHSTFQSNCVTSGSKQKSNNNTNNAVASNIVDLAFRGLLQSDVVCMSCHAVSTTCDPFLDVSLQLKTAESEELSTLNDCLYRYTRKEAISGVYVCEACKSKEQITKQLSFKSLPMVLCFHLKRFSHGDTTTTNTRSKRRSSDKSMNGKKISSAVAFDMELDMHPYTSECMFHENTTDKETQKRELYSLFAVVQHKGSMDSGHYTSYVKHNKHWYLCDDSMIYATKEEDVLNCQAYLLFYVRNQLPYH